MKNFLSLKETVAECERHHIFLVLRGCKNDKVKAAKVSEGFGNRCVITI